MDIKKKRAIIASCIIIVILCIGMILLGSDKKNSGNLNIKNYYAAKRHLIAIWSENAKTFYCGCLFDGKLIKPFSCGYQSKNGGKRSRIREWEHIVSASRFGAKIEKCRNEGALRRHCLRKSSIEFNLMEADMHNIVPAIGEINAARRNFSFGEVIGEVRRYGKCDFEVKNGIVEPRRSIRGNIARAYLYMSKVYPEYVFLTDAEIEKFQTWSKNDPPDAREKRRNILIEEIQGNRNSFIE